MALPYQLQYPAFANETTHFIFGIIRRLDSYGVAWKSFTEQHLDSTGMFRDAVIAILATIAKQEHARLSERVVAGLRRAKREGKVLGRKRIILDREKIRARHSAGESVRAIAGDIGVSKSLVATIVTRACRTDSQKSLNTAVNASFIQ